LVDLLITAAPELSAVTTENGSSPLYLAASIGSLEMVKAIVRTSQDGTPSPASYSGPEGRRGSPPDLSRLAFDLFPLTKDYSFYQLLHAATLNSYAQLLIRWHTELSQQK
jgi:hypothetical protein